MTWAIRPWMKYKLVELESSQLRDLYLHYGRVATVVSSAEEHDVYKLVEILKWHLRDKCDVLVKECKDQPLLCCYTADATSLLCRADASAASGARMAMRRGKVLEELLMQNSLSCWDGAGGCFACRGGAVERRQKHVASFFCCCKLLPVAPGRGAQRHQHYSRCCRSCCHGFSSEALAPAL